MAKRTTTKKIAKQLMAKRNKEMTHIEKGTRKLKSGLAPKIPKD